MPKLPDPHPSPPTRVGEYVLYLWRHRDPDHFAIQIFCEPYAVRKFMDEVMGPDGEYVWETETTIRTETGVLMRMHGAGDEREDTRLLKRCVEHEYTVAEMGYDLSSAPEWLSCARRYRTGSFPALETEEQVRERRTRKPSAPTATHPPGAVHVSDVALALGVEPRAARAALRGVMEKPAYGWWFKPDEVEGIKAKIKERVS